MLLNKRKSRGISWIQKVILVTDGKKLKAGDIAYQVCILDSFHNLKVHKTTVTKEITPVPSYCKYFSTEVLASIYVDQNEKKFSKKDIENAILKGLCFGGHDSFNLMIFKQKLGM